MSCSRSNDLERFLNGQLSPEEEAGFAAHLAQCPLCCDAMARLLESPSLPTMPMELWEEGEFGEAPQDTPLEFLRQLEPPAGLSERVTRELLRQKQKEFRQYCFQVVVSSCAAICIVFLGFANLKQPEFTASAQSLPLSEQLILEQRSQPGALSESFQNFSLDNLKEVFQRGKRNKFLTVLFACLPGAGHMYMGFMKLGLSFMCLFFGLIALVCLIENILYLDVVAVLFVLPIIWFYSFFDCINKRFCSDEAFQALEDHFLFTDNIQLPKFHGFSIFKTRAPRMVTGAMLLLGGINMLVRNLLRLLEMDNWDNLVYRVLVRILNYLPQVAISIGIILLGIWLIMGKRREIQAEYQEIKELTDHHEE